MNSYRIPDHVWSVVARSGVSRNELEEIRGLIGEEVVDETVILKTEVIVGKPYLAMRSLESFKGQCLRFWNISQWTVSEVIKNTSACRINGVKLKTEQKKRKNIYKKTPQVETLLEIWREELRSEALLRPVRESDESKELLTRELLLLLQAVHSVPGSQAK